MENKKNPIKKRTFFLKILFLSLIKRRSRMLVTLLAVSIGATILSGLLAIYYDIPRQMGKTFRQFGANLIILPKDNQDKISQDQIQIIKSILPPDQTVGITPYTYESIKLNEQPVVLVGSDIDNLKKTNAYWLIDGEWPTETDDVLVGAHIAKLTSTKIGDSIILSVTREGYKQMEEGSAVDLNENLRKRGYRVSGIVSTGGAEESFIYTSYESLWRLQPKSNLIDVIEASIEGDQAVLEEIVQDLQQKDPDILPRIAQRLTQSQDIVLNKLKALVWLVTILILILMMICVTTTMMAVVSERTREIGLKKALGAENKSVVVEFLTEAATLGSLGGLIGSIFGFYFSNIVSVQVFARRIAFHWELIPLTILVSAIITICACLIPVKRVLDVDPVIVLRGE